MSAATRVDRWHRLASEWRSRSHGPAYRQYLRELDRAIGDAQSVLDIGCGAASPLKDLPRRCHAVGVDAHRPSIEASRRDGIHDEYLEQRVDELDVPDDSFDVVVMLDLIEHFPPDAAAELLATAERIARSRVVISTPNGFLEQGVYDHNPYQVHHSGWTVDDLQARGYHVRGVMGLKPLRGELSRFRRPRPLTAPLSIVSQPLATSRPRWAFELMAVKPIR